MWIYDEKELDESLIDDYIGFVYIITNLTNNKKYIGKKLFKSTRSKKVKGKTRRKRVIKETDWKKYWGSNEELKEDVKKLGESNFQRKILNLCKTKGECNYFEAKHQFVNEVLENDDWYNGHIWVRVHKKHINPK
jgi:hypothetical protein